MLGLHFSLRSLPSHRIRDVLVLLGASIFLDLQRTANLVPLGLPVEYSKLCGLQSLNVLFPPIAHDTRPSDVYKTLYETLRFLPSTCKTLYFSISLAESKGFKYFLFAFEELLDTLRVGVYPLVVKEENTKKEEKKHAIKNSKF